MAVQYRQHEDAVGCRTFCSGLSRMFVFDILQIPSGYIHICNWCIAPTGNHLDYGTVWTEKNYENAESGRRYPGIASIRAPPE
jgi:hypothetical protein